jgi:hypothetical protein
MKNRYTSRSKRAPVAIQTTWSTGRAESLGKRIRWPDTRVTFIQDSLSL